MRTINDEQENIFFDITKELFNKYGKVQSEIKQTQLFGRWDCECITNNGTRYRVEIKTDNSKYSKYPNKAHSVIKNNKYRSVLNNGLFTYYVVYNYDERIDKSTMYIYTSDKIRETKLNGGWYNINKDQSNPHSETQWEYLHYIPIEYACFTKELDEDIHNILKSRKQFYEHKY